MKRDDKDISTTKIKRSVSKFSVYRWFFLESRINFETRAFVFQTKTITAYCFNPLNAGSVSKKTPENNLIFPRRLKF